MIYFNPLILRKFPIFKIRLPGVALSVPKRAARLDTSKRLHFGKLNASLGERLRKI